MCARYVYIYLMTMKPFIESPEAFVQIFGPVFINFLLFYFMFYVFMPQVFFVLQYSSMYTRVRLCNWYNEEYTLFLSLVS